MRIVFLGDFITDSGRDRTDDRSLGDGYVKILADKLRPIYPDKDIELINKGISDDQTCDLLSRVQCDVIDLKPDAVVIMTGINDLVNKFKTESEFDFEKFENDLRTLLKTIKDAGIVIIFIEPFLLPVPDKLRMKKHFSAELEIIGRVAGEIADEYVALNEMLNGTITSIHYREYSADGIHPTHRCSRLIADNVIKVLRRCLL